ncbi:MAG: succinate dehydrogenase cytochrome b558 subunit [Parachlamydiaceae bacterium]
MTENIIPSSFIWRRLHSITGIWLALFIIFHLLTNSQAALPLGDDGIGFVRAVNSIHDLPYLHLIEIGILGVPILIHALWGIHYLYSASYNSFGKTGHTPYLPEYPRNRAYTWQRITAWILVLGVIGHIVHMRFIEYPTPFGQEKHAYIVRVSLDDGIYSLTKRLDIQLETKHQGISLKRGEAVAVAKDFGTAELLMVRETFKMPIMLVLYTLFVLTACFHAFNGLWTAAITWGIALTERAQRIIRYLTVLLMVSVASLGLCAIWLTYWINLKG